MTKRSTLFSRANPRASTQALVLGLLLIACRETRGESDRFHGDERDGSDTPDVEAPRDAASNAPADAAADARARDAAPPPSDGAPLSDDDATAPSDGQTGPYKWYDSTVPPAEGAWPVDAEVRSGSVDAGVDRGCIVPTFLNAEGVGASCAQNTRDQVCFRTRTCNEALTLRGLEVPSPYYCTRPCLQHSDCGNGASCCTVPGLGGNACILDGCRHSCR
jgi:hypothetical protein